MHMGLILIRYCRIQHRPVHDHKPGHSPPMSMQQKNLRKTFSFRFPPYVFFSIEKIPTIGQAQKKNIASKNMNATIIKTGSQTITRIAVHGHIYSSLMANPN